MSENRMLLDEIRELKRRLQALETRQEHPGFAASDVARLSVANTFAGVQTLPNTGLHILDTNGTHDLIIAPGSNLTADRTLTLTTGDADRTLTMTGNATVNQDVSTAGSPVFVQVSTPAIVTASGALTVTPAAGSGVAIALSGAGDFVVNTTQFVVDTSTGRIGVGKADSALTQKFEVNGNMIVYAEGGASNLYIGDIVNANKTYAGFRTSADTGGYLEIQVIKQTGAYGDVIINPNGGRVSIGPNTTALGKLHVDQSSTTSAVPALLLDQADISEGFIDYVGTSAASAAGPISSWTTATIAGFVRCEINGAARWMAFYNDPTS